MDFNVKELKKRNGQINCNLEELKTIYIAMNRPKTNIVKLKKKYYISLSEAPNVQFRITDQEINDDKLSFIETKKFIYADSKKEKLIHFFITEFLQGKSIPDKIFRFITTAAPLIFLNLSIFSGISEKNVHDLFSAQLTAISIFAAIFSLFTVSHEYMERKKINLFESGKLSYYFSIDQHIAEMGISTILMSLFGILLSSNGDTAFIQMANCTIKWAIIILLNLSLLFTFLILRAIIEFYIQRPAMFILGDMKKKSLSNFSKEKTE